MSVDWGVIAGGLFSVITAGVAYSVAVRKHSETTKDSDKSIYVAAVTNERAKWREELRKSVATLCMLGVENEPSIAKLQQAKTEILLRLNPRACEPALAQRHKLDREITEAVNAIFLLAQSSERHAMPELVLKLEASAQQLLKQEWEKSKTEAQSGKVK